MLTEKRSGLGITHFHRRQHPRIDLSLPVAYTLEDSSEWPSTKSGSIGCGGLMLYLSTPVEKGTRMGLKLYLPDHLTIACAARVVWTELRTGEERDHFKAGVEFENISEQDFAYLRDFIKKQQNPIKMPPSLDGDPFRPEPND